MRGVIHKSLGLCAGLLLLIPASALAGEATAVGAIARYDAYFGETNNVTVSELAGPTADTKFIVFADVNVVDAGAGCGDLPGNAAACLVPATTTLARAGLGNKNDRIQPLVPDLSFGFSVEGDLGDDVLIGTQRRDILDGVGGNDTLRGRSANDALIGDTGNDDLRGDAGPDTMQGGAGDDVLDGDDNAGGDSIDCGEDWGDDDFALYNGGSPGDVVFSNCERTQQG
jgi:hypothetical protein